MTTENHSSPSPAASVELTIPGFRPPGESPQREEASPPARLPRVARLMALAVKYQEMVARGEMRDYADIARLGWVTRARITQIMNLLLLSPRIQEALLDLTPSVLCGVSERHLRDIARHPIWADQLKAVAKQFPDFMRPEPPARRRIHASVA